MPLGKDRLLYSDPKRREHAIPPGGAQGSTRIGQEAEWVKEKAGRAFIVVPLGNHKQFYGWLF